MAYEKPYMEIVRFDELKEFMAHSSGTKCFFYGALDDYVCYDVDKGDLIYAEGKYRSICNDYTGYPNPCNVILCTAVENPREAIV